MAKLYPPNIAGILPSFYELDYGATVLVVPFSMNKTVSPKQITGFKLRLKTANTDILYGIIDSIPGSWNSAEIVNPQVSFTIPNSILNKLTIGYFYKVQIAYVDNYGDVGYYSTVGIIKYTSKPRLEISGFNASITNINPIEYIGEYHNVGDPSEKAYEYKFDLYDNGDNLIESSGWLLHNSYEDTELTSSIDRYLISYAFPQNVTHKIQYTVKTNNNLIVASPKYLVMDTKSIDPEIQGSLIATLNYDNSCIDLKLIGKEHAITGAFILTRASSLDNYSSWLEISNFKLIGELPSKFIFKDFTIEHGVKYIYSLQQYNDYGVYSSRLLTDYILAQFEDAYLYDGERQLRIRFNPKISSFKTVVQESKKTTIGGKYPFIMRNGAVEYKEFPINGLISYYMDNEEFFLSKEEKFNLHNWTFTTDITDENMYVERRFKLEVLEWLNNGKVKLFKSPQEGNYIVRLMNVGLTPIDSTSRMLHNFSCQASEVATLNYQSLTEYGFINTDAPITYQMRWETVDLQSWQIELSQKKAEQIVLLKERLNNGSITNEQYNTSINILNKEYSIYGKDLLNGYNTYSIKMTDMIMGTKFSFVDASQVYHEFMIGATGAYEVVLDEPVKNLMLVAPNYSQEENDGTLFENDTMNTTNMILNGSITFSILSTTQNRFDSITEVTIRDIPIHQVFGPDENILSQFHNFRRNVTRLYYMRFSALEVREVYNDLFGTQLENGTYLTSIVQTLQPSKAPEDTTSFVPRVYNIPTIDKDGQVINNYYRYYEGKLYAQPHFSTVFEMLGVLNAYTLYKDGNNYYRLNGDQLINAEPWIINKINNNSYQIAYTDLTPYIIYRKRNTDVSKDKYFKYDGSKLIELSEYSTSIEYTIENKDANKPNEVVIFDVADKQNIYIPELSEPPLSIKIGSGVCAEIGLQICDMVYNIEDYCETEKKIYEAALLAYHQAAIGFKTCMYEDVPEKDAIAYMKSNNEYFIWTGKTFELIEDYDYDDLIQKLQKKQIVFYAPSSVNATQAELDILFEKLVSAENAFIEAIKYIVEKQKEIYDYE